jgi:hypothetical protein
MKRILLFLAYVVALVACAGPKDVPYTVLDHYFFKNGQEIPDDPKIDSEEEFSALFGMAAVMGKDGMPTPVDFSKEFVIAVVKPVTDQFTELSPVSLQMSGGELVFTYSETTGERMTWSMQPLLLVKADRRYGTAPVRLVKL